MSCDFPAFSGEVGSSVSGVPPSKEDLAVQSVVDDVNDRIVESLIVPIVFLGAVALIMVICATVFGGKVGIEIGTTVFVLGGLVVFTPLRALFIDYFKFEVLKREGDPLDRKGEPR